MKIDQSLYEGVLHDDKTKSILYSLKSKLLDERIVDKIKNEININWNSTNEIKSMTLITIIQNVVSKYIENITVSVDNHMEEFGHMQDLTDGNYSLCLNILALAKESGISKILRIKDEVVYIEDFLIQCIDTCFHELVHFLQMRTRLTLDNSTLNKIYSKDEYFNRKDELMSYAAELVSNLKSQGYTKKQAIEIIQKGEDEEGFKSSKIYNLYRKIPKIENWNTFMKYIYKYLERWDDL